MKKKDELLSRQKRIKSGSGYCHIMLLSSWLLSYEIHVHLMLREGVEDVATMMKCFTVSYVYYYNKKYRRVGHLFQDRFKSDMVRTYMYWF